MEAATPLIAVEVKDLKAYINDLMVVLALPAIWSGGEPRRIVRTLADVLVGMLRLDLVYVWLKDEVGGAPVEMVRVPPAGNLGFLPHEIGEVFNHWLENDPSQWPPLIASRLAGVDISFVPLRLGMHGEMGAVVVGSRRTRFPEEAEKLLLNVAANQAAMALQEARLLRQQKTISRELDRRVEHRTAQLAAANEQLKKEIAERKLAVERLCLEHRELKRSEALLAETQRLSSTGSFTWRVLTNDITWSEQSYRIFEVDRATPVTLELIADRIHPEDLPAFQRHLERACNDGCDARFDFRLQLPDGQIKHLHVLAHRVRDELGKDEIVGAIMDVSEATKSQLALHAAETALAHAGRVATLAEISATIAHEINQPLAAIVANAGASLRWQSGDVPSPEKIKQLTTQIISDACRASDIVQRIRGMTTKHEPERVPIDLIEVVAESLLFIRPEVGSRPIQLSVKLGTGLPPVLGDRIQLQQVIVNLLVNSIQAVKQAEKSVCRIELDTSADKDGAVSFSIRDTGPGIADENLERVFESFFTTKEGGMGIGLAICHSIIAAHGGSIGVSNHPEGGARFRLVLPPISWSTSDEKRTVSAESDT